MSLPERVNASEASEGGIQGEKHVDMLETSLQSDSERQQSPHKKDGVDYAGLKLDSKGLPLVPQPSRFKDDPLNWPPWLKWVVLIQVSFMAFLGPFNAAVINPTLVPLSKYMGVDTTTGAYSTTTGIILGGVGSFLWAPLSNVYGRRPITLLAISITICGAVGSAVSPDFAALVGTRALCGFGFSGMMSVGTAVVNDMFFLHERGEKTGVYTIFVTNGAHFAVIGGGYLGQYAGWRWDFWLPAIIDSVSLVVAIFLLPETLFSRAPDFLAERTHERTYWEMLFHFKGNLIPNRRLHAGDFLHSFYMLKYPSVTFCFWYYTWAWTFVNILPAITMATIYTGHYGFTSGPIGLCLGISLIIGSVLGEASTGKMSDFIMYRLAKKHGDVRRPETRLYLSPLSALFMPVGIIIFGVCVEKNTHYIIPLIGLAIGVYGLQVASTCIYAYVSDCYKPQTPESGVLLNLSRGLSFSLGFYALPLANRIGFDLAWMTFALLLFAFFFPVGALIIWGERWRNALGAPTFHRYL